VVTKYRFNKDEIQCEGKLNEGHIIEVIGIYLIHCSDWLVIFLIPVQLMLNSFKALAAELFVFKKKACLIICKNKELGIEKLDNFIVFKSFMTISPSL
jgi:hypothetical protein